MKDFIIDCIEQARGDDLYRAKRAFEYCTNEEMSEEYGSSGKTRTEVLAEYIAHDAKCTCAINWLEKISSENPESEV